MDLAATLVSEGAAHGVVVAAREQTAGRGRRGAAWASPAGAGLYFSFIAKPASMRGIALITLAAGVGVRDGVVNATGLAPELKWPNDLLVGRRKLAGILAEGHNLGSPDGAIVIGAGINVQPAAYPDEVRARATSIEGELGRAVDADLLLEAILNGLDARLTALAHDPGDILQAWRAAAPTANGTRVEWDGRHGVTSGIDDTGALLIRTSNHVERIIAGDIHWNL
jgi:BirA family biotin operon repressor/biotin-[acetyl-CoA-carboxylase] ligase